MGGKCDSISNENDEGFEQDVAHPKSGDKNVEYPNNVNSNTNTRLGNEPTNPTTTVNF